MGIADEIFDTMGAPFLQERLITTVQYSRPTRIPDGEGGSFTVMGTEIALACDPIIQGNEYGLSVPVEIDIRIGDLIKVPYNLFL